MNNDNIDFSTIWKQQKVNQPDMEDLLIKLKQFKKSNLLKLIFVNISLIVTSCFIILIWYVFKPQLITTKIGIVLIILAMIIFIFSTNKLFFVFNKINNAQSNIEYLQSLATIKTKQKFIQTTIIGLYFILLSVGICLYLYEYTSRMTIGWAIFSYLITLAWIGFDWFYIRPRTIKKQEMKLDELINKFESINKQLKEE